LLGGSRTAGIGGVNALANCAAVLRHFSADRRQLSVTEAAAMLGMPKSSASRLLKAMKEAGLLRHVAGTPRYEIGNLLFEVARLHRSSSDLTEMADQELRVLTRETGHTGYVSILDRTDVMAIRVHRGSHALQVVTPIGQRAPAFATANGRALLARLTDAEVRALHRGGLNPPSANAPQSVKALLAALGEIRQSGHVTAIDEAVPGVGSIAVSVGDAERQEALGFCLSFPAGVPLRERRRIRGLLVAAARRIAVQLDDPFWRGIAPQLPRAA
jgi:DNA-binding IclR family transcriptional regulator